MYSEIMCKLLYCHTFSHAFSSIISPSAVQDYMLYFRHQYKRTEEVMAKMQNISRKVDHVLLMLEDGVTRNCPVDPSISSLGIWLSLETSGGSGSPERIAAGRRGHQTKNVTLVFNFWPHFFFQFRDFLSDEFSS